MRDRIVLSKKQRFEILRRDNFACFYCKTRLEELNVVLDHIIPFAKWWECNRDNLVSCCKSCNIWKSDTLLPNDFDTNLPDIWLEDIRSKKKYNYKTLWPSDTSIIVLHDNKTYREIEVSNEEAKQYDEIEKIVLEYKNELLEKYWLQKLQFSWWQHKFIIVKSII